MHSGSATVVAVIPVRGGSRRVVRKNLMKVNGMPLLAHPIEAEWDS